MRKLVIGLGALVGLGGIALIPVGGGRVPAEEVKATVQGIDLSSYSDAPPGRPLSLVFLHHSCGGQLLADEGREVEQGGRCLYDSHPNGGGLRKRLGAAGYEVHEASYGSELGNDTDMFDWLPKFRARMDKILTVDRNDSVLSGGRAHQIVLFKSCYTESRIAAEGEAPGNPAGPDKTYWNARATLTALLPEMQKHPEVLYVYLTSPPLAPVVPRERLYKYLAKTILGKPHWKEVLTRQAAARRKLNGWIVSPDGWLADYPLENVVVFDYYDILTDRGASNLSRYASQGGADDHPSSVGNQKAAAAFVPFLNRAVRRAGLVP